VKSSKQKNTPSATSEQTAPPSAKPTTAQLASLAAALSKEGTETYCELVKQALGIWEAAHELLTNPQPPVEPERPRLSEPKGYPVNLDEFLRLMLPHLSGRTGEKYSLFREYLKFRLRNPSPPPCVIRHHRHAPIEGTSFDCLNPQVLPPTEGLLSGYSADKPDKPATPPEPTKDDVDKRFALWQANPIPDRTSFHYHARYFRSWYETTHSAEIKAKRRAAGAKGNASPRREKGKKADGTKDERTGAHTKKRLTPILRAVAGLDTISRP
jgi:hypothetical protein